MLRRPRFFPPVLPRNCRMFCDPTLIAALGYDFVPVWGNLLLAIWLWCFGANVGSFMNVVVYRVPRGRSVVHPGSRCPRCTRPIAWYDNIPILSWMLLGARCRWCREPISARYPTVETLMAALFLVVAFLSPIALERYDLRGPGTSLEMLPPWVMYAYQMLLLSTLVCAALIRFDDLKPPVALFAPAWLVGLIAPQLPPAGLWLPARPLAFAPSIELPVWSVALLDSTTGLAVGTALGLIVWRASRHGGSRSPATSETQVMMLTGLMLGWQGACWAALIAAATHLLVSLAACVWNPLTRIPWTAPVVIGGTAFILAWPSLEAETPYLASEATAAWFGVSALLVAGLAWLAAITRPVRRRPPNPPAPSETETAANETDAAPSASDEESMPTELPPPRDATSLIETPPESEATLPTDGPTKTPWPENAG